MDTHAELAREHSVLARADADLWKGARRVAAQEALVAELRARGLDLREAERLLLALRETLDQWRQHRVLIRRHIARLEDRLGADGQGWVEWGARGGGRGRSGPRLQGRGDV